MQVPAHSRIPGNESVDKLAKEAVKRPNVESQAFKVSKGRQLYKGQRNQQKGTSDHRGLDTANETAHRKTSVREVEHVLSYGGQDRWRQSRIECGGGRSSDSCQKLDS